LAEEPLLVEDTLVGDRLVEDVFLVDDVLIEEAIMGEATFAEEETLVEGTLLTEERFLFGEALLVAEAGDPFVAEGPLKDEEDFVGMDPPVLEVGRVPFPARASSFFSKSEADFVIL
jgi:hypothetical protein